MADKSPKIAVMSWACGDLPHFPASAAILKAYCERHGYQAIVDTTAPESQENILHWHKITAIKNTLTGAAKDCDFLLYLDADAFFYGMDYTIERELIPLLGDKDLLVAADCAHEKMRWNPELPNSGVMFFRNSSKTLEMLDAWERCPAERAYMRHAHPWDQLGLWHVILPNYRENIALEPNYYLMNGWYGQFVRHLALTPNELRRDVMQAFCEEKNIEYERK